jgi:hypothetical protein
MLRGEQRLMLAVLEDGIATLLKHARATRGQAARVRRETFAWLVATSRDELFGYERLCEALGIDGARLRRRVLSEMRRRLPA